MVNADGTGKNGTFIVELTNPLAPKTVSFVGVEQGTHNHTIHPSGNYLYNSNSDLITSIQPAIEIYDISSFATPHKVKELALPTRPGLGTESHDITFNTAGDRAYSAALSQGVIINTTNPARPTIVSSFLDPTINVWHQMDPFTMTDAQGNRREFLIAEDEVAGAIGTGQCPNGGVHVYDITGDKELSPEKVGYWNIDDIRPTANVTDSCTAHVFDIHEREQMMTIAYYNGGVHVVDLSGLTGISLGDSTQVGGPGMREIGYYRTENGDGTGMRTRGPSGAEGQPDRRLLSLRQRHRARARRLQVLQRAGPLAARGALDDAGRGTDRPRRPVGARPQRGHRLLLSVAAHLATRCRPAKVGACWPSGRGRSSPH